MKKRTLVSLLAIPIFSLATTFNSFSATPFNSYQESKKIKPKQVGAAVIDFLLRNPKTADKMEPNERIALDIIGDLLKTQGQREHEIEYATAGRNQLTINTSDGRQAQFVKDKSGNIYLVMDGVIHPIAQELINQASNIPSIDNATLPPYNLRGLENMFNSNPKEDISQKYKNEISAVFSYKWYRDLDNDGVFNFNEFNQIKRTFYNDEDFYIAIDYQTEKGFIGDLEVKIFEDYTGKLIWNEKMYYITLSSNEGPMIRGCNIPAGRFPIGIYLIHTNLNDDITSRTVSSKSERFEIIQNTSKTTEKKY